MGLKKQRFNKYRFRSLLQSRKRRYRKPGDETSKMPKYHPEVRTCSGRDVRPSYGKSNKNLSEKVWAYCRWDRWPKDQSKNQRTGIIEERNKRELLHGRCKSFVHGSRVLCPCIIVVRGIIRLELRKIRIIIIFLHGLCQDVCVNFFDFLLRAC